MTGRKINLLTGEKMKPIKELSQKELVNLIYNTWDDTDVHKPLARCAVCGSGDTKYHYICDKCDPPDTRPTLPDQQEAVAPKQSQVCYCAYDYKNKKWVVHPACKVHKGQGDATSRKNVEGVVRKPSTRLTSPASFPLPDQCPEQKHDFKATETCIRCGYINWVND